MGAEGSRRSMGTTGARRQFWSILHPNTVLKPNPDPAAHTNPKPSRNPTPAPSPYPNQDSILGPSWWGKEHRLGDFGDK